MPGCLRRLLCRFVLLCLDVEGQRRAFEAMRPVCDRLDVEGLCRDAEAR